MVISKSQRLVRAFGLERSDRISIRLFKKTVWGFYKYHKRLFPWRDIDNLYFILVSEVMLQQTQAPRVIEKYNKFIARFPTAKDLAAASNSDVLGVWQGLGYNRRALFLKRAAEKIVSVYEGAVPSEIDELQSLTGIGYNTACAIVSFAYNKPTVFIETNIRTVFIHHFFNDQQDVSDKEIIRPVEKTLDFKKPRDWYYALIDYGVYLKKEFKNPSRKSKTYTKQSKFEGSKRQLRGEVIRILLKQKEAVLDDIDKKVLSDLEKEGLIKKKKQEYTIA